MIPDVIIKSLKTLGFENDEDIPMMKEVRKQFFKLSIEKHPDKNNGIDKGFGELKSAFDLLCTR